jgi:hypothetical protein
MCEPSFSRSELGETLDGVGGLHQSAGGIRRHHVSRDQEDVFVVYNRGHFPCLRRG